LLGLGALSAMAAAVFRRWLAGLPLVHLQIIAPVWVRARCLNLSQLRWPGFWRSMGNAARAILSSSRTSSVSSSGARARVQHGHLVRSEAPRPPIQG
jgi:hypothetical protein